LSEYQIVLFALLLVFLIILSGFFSCSETALMALNRYKLRHQARMKKRYAMRLLKLLKRPDRLLGVVLIGNTFANILASSLLTLITFHFLGEKGAILSALGLTFIVLIIAEIAPKTLAAIYPDRVARLVAYPIQIILQILYPFVWLANMLANGLLRLLRIRVTQFAIEPLTREELRSVVYDTRGKISRQYQNMLLSILDLSKLTVEDVMIPRHEIQGIDVDLTWEEILAQIYSFHQDWAPVYRDNINQVMGILYIRDVSRLLLAQQPLNKELLMQFLQEPYFVPEGTALNVQLGYFQQNQDKIAFVVDEYGEIQGMVTLNDILEEIVGDFTSHAGLDKHIRLQEDGSYLVDGSVGVREFNRFTSWELPSSGPRTLNGLIVEYLEALPHKGIALLIAGYPIEILQVKEKRVRAAKIFPRLAEYTPIE